jgi:hypothetical protein
MRPDGFALHARMPDARFVDARKRNRRSRAMNGCCSAGTLPPNGRIDLCRLLATRSSTEHGPASHIDVPGRRNLAPPDIV